MSDIYAILFFVIVWQVSNFIIKKHLQISVIVDERLYDLSCWLVT